MMKTIEEQIKEVEEDLSNLKAIQEKEMALENGALKSLENNVLKDVIIRSYYKKDGQHIFVSFKLNEKLIEVDFIQSDNFDSSDQILLAIKNEIANVVLESIKKS